MTIRSLQTRFLASAKLQFCAAFLLFLLLAGIGSLWLKKEYSQKKARAIQEREYSGDKLERLVQKYHGVRSSDADEIRVKLVSKYFYFERKYDEVLPILDELCENGMTPQLRANALFLRGHIYGRIKGDLTNAVKSFRPFFQMPEAEEEKRPEAALFLAAASLNAGNTAEAKRYLDFILSSKTAEPSMKQAAVNMLKGL